MVEHQHSINTILSFGAKSVNPKILEKLLIGREKTADYLYDAAKAIAEDNNNQQILIIGQRGMGKTHLLRVLYYRIQHYIEQDKIVVAYFSEEEYGVSNYFDFLIRVINAFMKWYDSDENELSQKITELQEVQVKARESFAEEIIEQYIRKRPLLILAENFADILEAISVREQEKLRSWLYRVNKISIIATSQAISDDFDREDRPLYGFFNTYYLKNLNYTESRNYLIQLAKIDKRKDVVEFLETKGQGQVKALYRLVKGNHRLLVTFYQFLKTDTISKLSVNFIKTINDLKPYYETYIRYLPAQQQKILRFIALSRKPKQGVDISKKCFIDQKSTTKQLSELSRKKLIEVITDPSDKRKKLYDINEPLLRISIEVGEHREGITALFIDFLAIYYDENELKTKKQNFSKLIELCVTEQEKTNYFYEIKALDRAIELKKTEYAYLDENVEEIINQYLEKKDEKGLCSYLIKTDKVENELEFYILLIDFYLKNDRYEEEVEVIKRNIKKFPNNFRLYVAWAYGISRLANKKNNEKLYLESFKKYKKAARLNPNNDRIYSFWGNGIAKLANLKKDEKLYLESFEKYKKANYLAPNNSNIYDAWGKSISELARLKKDEKLYLESFEKYKKATDLEPKNNNAFYNWGNTIKDLAILKKDNTLYLESFKKYEKAININSKDSDAYNNWGITMVIYANNEIGNVDFYFKGIQKLIKAIEIDSNKLNSYGFLFFIIGGMVSTDKRIIPIIFTILKILKKSKLKNLLNQWLLLALKSSKELDKKELNILLKIANKNKKQIPELSIIETYIQIYEKYYLEKDKAAIYDLPKEQRLFFIENILNEEI